MIEYAEGTFIEHNESWLALTKEGYHHRGKAKCTDGKVRSVRIHNVPDFWFSFRARCKMHRTTVTGYISIDDGVVKFYS